jgi:type IV pilus assembly protein PilM
VIGLGNGFKLAGMKEFLDKNVEFEVAKLDRFKRLVGDEVVRAPQFEDNLPSFAVAYGLGVQGLDSGKMKTNLLTHELDHLLMIRRKKPWALAA